MNSKGITKRGKGKTTRDHNLLRIKQALTEYSAIYVSFAVAIVE
jgi:hypothetical protein